jgi:hypothetical protein
MQHRYETPPIALTTGILIVAADSTNEGHCGSDSFEVLRIEARFEHGARSVPISTTEQPGGQKDDRGEDEERNGGDEEGEPEQHVCVNLLWDIVRSLHPIH